MKEYGTIRLVTNFEYFHNASLPYGTLTRTPWPDVTLLFVLYPGLIHCYVLVLLPPPDDIYGTVWYESMDGYGYGLILADYAF